MESAYYDLLLPAGLANSPCGHHPLTPGVPAQDGRGAYDILLNDIGGGVGLQESSCGSGGGSSSEEDEGPAVARGS